MRKRKIVQVALSAANEWSEVVAVADDGTAWSITRGTGEWRTWKPLPPLPDAEADDSAF